VHSSIIHPILEKYFCKGILECVNLDLGKFKGELREAFVLERIGTRKRNKKGNKKEKENRPSREGERNLFYVIVIT
jgi:hypothetical protein